MNERLRLAREATPSRAHPGASMGRDELASLVAGKVQQSDPKGRMSAFDSGHLGKLERGSVKRPGPAVRAALCSLLGASERDLGFVEDLDQDKPVQLDSRAVRGIADVLASVRTLEESAGAAGVLPTVQAQHALALRIADAARGPARRPALDLVANVETYLGWLTLSAGRSADARGYLERACVVSLEGDLPQRLATALSFLAYRSQRRGDLMAAADQTEAAGRDPRVNPGLRAYLSYQRAEFLAKDGQMAEALAAIQSADRLADTLSAGSWSQPGYFAAHRSFALTALGDSVSANRAADEARALLPAYSATLPLRLRQAHHRLA